MRPLRAFTAGLGVETNTFSRLEVGMDDFRRTFLFKPGEHPDMLTAVSAPLHVLRRRRDEHGWTLVEGTYAFALPRGRTLRAAYEHLRAATLAPPAAVGTLGRGTLSLPRPLGRRGFLNCEGDQPATTPHNV